MNKFVRALYPHAQRWARFPFSATYSVVSAVRGIRPGSVLLACTRSGLLTDNLAAIEARLDRGKYSIREFYFPSSLGFFARTWRGLRFAVAMARTHYTIVDDVFPPVYAIRVRPGARLIQAWHALGALKRMGYSRHGGPGGPVATSITHKNYTDVIVSGEGVRDDYAEAFGVDRGVVRATGVPRSDLFFDAEAQARAIEEVYETWPDWRGRRIILFAPTFRGPTRAKAHYPGDFVDLERLGEALGDEDLLVIRMHPFVTGRWEIPDRYRDRIVDAGAYPEFNHLLLVCDLLITDYSSAIFDYALLRRPVILYVPDLEEYEAGRGFYYPFEDYVYGSVARRFEDLVAALGNRDVDEGKLNTFCECFLNRCDGAATERFVRTIFGPVVLEEAGDG